VRSNGKLLRFALYPALLLLVAGCGGINASKSVSPLDFFLPGLMQADPPPAQQPDRAAPAAEPVMPVKQVAKI
jgi:hypothetical protein